MDFSVTSRTVNLTTTLHNRNIQGGRVEGYIRSAISSTLISRYFIESHFIKNSGYIKYSVFTVTAGSDHTEVYNLAACCLGAFCEKKTISYLYLFPYEHIYFIECEK